MNVDLDKRTTQATFSRMVGVTQPAVSGLIARDVLAANDTAGNWLLAYCGHLRAAAAGRASDGDLDLTKERARLAAAQADKLELELAVTRAELAPVQSIEAVLAAAGSKIGAQLDSIPMALKRRIPQMTDADVALVRGEIALVRNTVAAMSLEDLEDEEGDTNEVV